MKNKKFFALFSQILFILGFALLLPQAQAQSPPNPPSGLTLFDRSHVSFQVRWNAPDTGGGAPITGYDVRYRDTAEFQVWPHTAHTTDTTFEINGLALNTSYEVQVRAVSADGNSAWSNSEFTITMGLRPPLTRPSDLVASGITGTSFRVSWIPPYTVDGAVLTGYEVKYRLYASFQGAEEKILDAGHTGLDAFIVITGVLEETIYSVQVIALTSDGKRHDSPHLHVETTGFRPNPPTGITAARTSSSIRLNWNAPQTPDDSPITGYEVRYRSMEVHWVNGNPIVSPFAEESTTGTETTFELKDLAPSTSYQIGVRTVVANSKSIWSPTLYVATRDTFRMDSPTVSERTSTSFRVNWKAAKFPDDSPLTGYKLRYRPVVYGQNLPSPYIEVRTKGTETTLKITGLKPNSGYEIGLQALGANGNSFWSNLTYVVTYTAFPINPPTDITTSERTSISLQVSWKTPDAAEGITLTRYTVRYRPAAFGKNALTPYTEVHTKGTETTLKITGLTPGTSYEIGVRALSASENSLWSSSVYTKTAVPPLVITKADVVMNSVIFNELRNAAIDAQDWVELRNVSDADAALDGWALVIASSRSSRILRFPLGTRLPAGAVLLLLNTDPSTPGMPLVTPEENSHRYLVMQELILPQTDWTMILQSQNGWEDVAGNYFFEGAKPSTAPPFTLDKAWYRTEPDTHGYKQAAWSESGYQDGLGYDDDADPATSLGTPGYLQDALTSAALAQETLAGDLNGDGVVNVQDLTLLSASLGQTGGNAADLNGDGVVNIQDLTLLAALISGNNN